MSRATVDLQSVRFFLGYGLVFILQSGADDPARRRSRCSSLAARAGRARADPGAVRGASSPTRYGRRSRPALQEVQQRIAELTADVEENISGVRVVKAFARRAAPARALPRHRSARVFDQSMVATRLRAFYNPFLGFLPNLGLAVILLVGGRQVINGTLTLGDFTAFYTYLLMLIGPMRDARHRARPGPARDRLGRAAVRDPRPRAADRRAGGRAAAAGGPRARRAARRHVRATTARRGRRCATSTSTSRPGSTVALVGATGSGKTTLVQLLPRLYDATRGRGADRRRRRARRRPRRRCAARSRSSTTTRSCSRRPSHDNIAYARPDASREEVERAARARAGRRLHRRAARRLRHARRRARADALAAASASGSRSRARCSPTRAILDPRRRDLLGRRHDRAARSRPRCAR